MKKKVRQGNLGIRAIAIVVTFSMVVSLMTVLGGNASAAPSLDGIEEIRDRRSLSILEIIPKEGTGSIGYYVAGREPIANWHDVLASKEDADARDEYAEQLFTNLKAAGLMGDKGTKIEDYPLTYIGDHDAQYGYYKEYLPWDTGRPNSAVLVSLDNAETLQAKGSFYQDDDGDYITDFTYGYHDGGDYVENALYYKYGEVNGANAASTYYYCLKFTKLEITYGSDESIAPYIGYPLYVPVSDPTIPGYTYYDYVGTLGSGGFTIDKSIYDSTGYFYSEIVTDVNDANAQKPSANWEEELQQVTLTAGAIDTALIGSTLYMYKTGDNDLTKIENLPADYAPVDGAVYYKRLVNPHNYYAEKNPQKPYTKVETGKGYFDVTTSYLFVGNGNANDEEALYYSFQADSNGDPCDLKYDTIYVSGSYTNNDWFKRYVLDMYDANSTEMSAVRINVHYILPENLTANMVKNYGLVVISAGFDLTNPDGTVAYTRDISEDVLNALKPLDTPKAKVPRLVDTRILNHSTTTPRLASLVDGSTYPSVTANNIYNFAVGTGTDARSALATNKFHTTFNTTTPYQVVVDEIEYENFLRGTKNPVSEEISMATCIRYLLNTHRVQNQKTSLNVLDIQPLAKKYTDNSTLSVADVQSWLPKNVVDNQIGNNITITHMSSAELICNIDDLAEKYDLIYIGAEAYGNNLPTGMYYANIGKEVNVGSELKGLLKGDLNSSNIKARYSGNDLTPQKKSELLEYAGYVSETTHKAGLPIVVSDKLVSGATAGPNYTLVASITNSGPNELKADYTLSQNLTVTNVHYQWWRKGTSPGSTWQTVDGATTATLQVSDDASYRCHISVKVNSSFSDDAISNTMKRTSAGPGDSNGNKQFVQKETGPYSSWRWENAREEEKNYFKDFTVTQNLATAELKASYASIGGDVKKDGDPTYSWYEVNSTSSVQSGKGNAYATLKITAAMENKYYYCKIEIPYKIKGEKDSVTRYSPAYMLTSNSGISGGGSFESTGNGTPATIQGASTSGDTLDPTKVDKFSLMYDALSSIWNYENVFVESSVDKDTSNASPTELAAKQDTLMKYLNLSRPEIDLDSEPEAYSGDPGSAASTSCRGNLEFTFQIKNPTDPTPLSTKYSCNLYIDQNGDGRHTEDEEIGDLELSVNEDELVADTTYTLRRQIGDKYSGIIAWKLEVVKVGDSSVHASQKGYAYNQPQGATPIHVLQILPTSGGSINLATDGVEENKYGFYDLYETLQEYGMYDISVTTVNVANLNSKRVFDTNNDGKIDTKDTPLSDATALYQQYLGNYNMLILGFADVYQDLENDTALAVAQYIDSGRAVLFTHDTTSFYSAADNENWTYVWKYWGYSFNKFIRDKVGLDRYGVTNSAFGSKQGTGTSATYGLISQGTDGAITVGGSTEKALLDAGYTVAYVPYDAEDSPTKQSSGATQGFTDLNINRFINPRPQNASESKTTQVSQVNEGQITQYPFMMHAENTPKYQRTLTVAETHHQYYQLNMNADDIVVWYCLSGNTVNYNYDQNHYNDGTNAYYIYNRGNITYSGAGHDQSLTTDEKQLFVNTMVAAYRAAYSDPKVNFVTASGKDTTTQLIPAEYSSKNSSQSLTGDQSFYFDVLDTNLTANKSVSVKLYYEVPESVAQTAATAANKNLSDYTLKSAGLGDNTETYVLEADLDNNGDGVDDIYRATGERVSNPQKLSNGVIYKATLPTDVLTNFPQNESKNQIYLKVTTVLNNDNRNTLSGKDVLTLQKLGLLRLE